MQKTAAQMQSIKRAVEETAMFSASILAFPDNGVDFDMMVYTFKVKSKIKDKKDREQFQNLSLSLDLQSK